MREKHFIPNRGVNEANLFARGAIKAIGVSWTEEELALIRSGEETVESLREATVGKTPVVSDETNDSEPEKTEEELKAEAEALVAKQLEKEIKAVSKMTKPNLIAKAEELGLEIDESATNPVLIEAITKKLSEPTNK